MKKVTSKTLFVLFFAASCHMMACSGGFQPGSGEGVTKQGNDLGGASFAAPTQSSGTLSPGIDPDPDPILYKAKFEPSDLVIEEQGISLKGIIEKKQDAPNMEGLALKVIDLRTKKFSLVPVTVTPSDASEAVFSVFLKAPAFNLEELLSGKSISLFLSPHPQDAVAVATSGEMMACENRACIDSDWFAVSFQSDVATTTFVPQGNPAPGVPSSPGDRPPGPVPMPGK
jgi:hypothetical protein